ncbi:cytochrome o ubiquinol oxidase subunit IV [Legionella waltersii]|uniref:Cytochrome bo(3) ubiquinol oxidase subunit 4 n=1 Tax=Legionella waltersii TaxID=66969 RepID=A0A0W1ABR3_9GAMM|nr:cytochrome o ubiquinol oxidase subunit IV [Legionella waltersii]KTD78774.1 cytochrome o ubiquinol oxidase subunit IV [Legionella waltersii]SNV11209.1 cytochrome o ubiquinol oxidase subunit IV [Legionella waltersii]
MEHHGITAPDYGTGQKKLGLYLVGFISCSLLTLLSFWVVMSHIFSKTEVLILIFSSACIQFLVQVLCFLRLSTQTEQGKTNVMSFLFTGVILTSIIVGSLWIMWNLNYYMMH